MKIILTAEEKAMSILAFPEEWQDLLTQEERIQVEVVSNKMKQKHNKKK